MIGDAGSAHMMRRRIGPPNASRLSERGKSGNCFHDRRTDEKSENPGNLQTLHIFVCKLGF